VDIRRALILAFALAVAPCVTAQDSARAIQERVKAAFLYKFAAYVEWPRDAFTEPASPIVIGVAGSDGIARELEQAVLGREVGGRPVQVRRLRPGESAGDCCQILFVGADNNLGQIAELLARAQGRPVLTVTDADKDHPKGSIINFLAAENKVRFDISRDAAERNGLQLRAQLLGVARQVTAR
jgi:uncharacterized protein DUF4154